MKFKIISLNKVKKNFYLKVVGLLFLSMNLKRECSFGDLDFNLFLNISNCLDYKKK
jgi:hypothetical protein